MNSFYSEWLLDRNLHPLNKDKEITATHSFLVTNESCGDKYTVALNIKNRIIIDASFSGSGCAISQASADMLADFLIGKKVSSIDSYREMFREMIQSGEKNSKLGEFNEFCFISKMPMRIKCAELPWSFCYKEDSSR